MYIYKQLYYLDYKICCTDHLKSGIKYRNIFILGDLEFFHVNKSGIYYNYYNEVKYTCIIHKTIII